MLTSYESMLAGKLGWQRIYGLKCRDRYVPYAYSGAAIVHIATPPFCCGLHSGLRCAWLFATAGSAACHCAWISSSAQC